METKTYFVVTGIVHYMDKLLILKKSDDDWNYPGYWSFCSGYIKEFEAAEDTVLREIKEETGLDAAIVKKGDIVKVFDQGKGKAWMIATFLCKSDSDKVVLDHENSDFRWISSADIDKYVFVPGIIDILRAIKLIG